MAVSSEIALLKRTIASLSDGAAADLKAKPPMAAADRRMLKQEIEACIQSLDELRARVSG